MTLKSNIIFDPDTSIEVFMDSVREVSSEHSREIVTYQKSQEAVVNTVARYRFPSVTQYIGTLQNDIIENKRKLVYLNAYADENIVVDGGNHNAIYGNVNNLRMANRNTSVCDVEFTTKAKGGVTGQFYDFPKNLVFNGDFAIGTGSRTSTGWIGAESYGWYGIVDAGNAKFEYDPSIYNIGSQSMRVSLTDVTGNAYVVSPLFVDNRNPMLPSTEYKLSAMVKTNNAATDAAFISLSARNAANSTIEAYVSTKLTGTNDWTYLEVDFTSHADTAYYYISLNNGVAGNISDVWFDDIQLVETSPTTDLKATGGYVELLNQLGHIVHISLNQTDYELPAGDYKLFVRMKDTAQIADDVKLEAYNVTDDSSIASDTFTATSGYTYFVLDFTTDSSEDGDVIKLSCEKATATTNSIYVDFLGFVKV